MSFFRPLRQAAPTFDPQLPWPFDGLAYVLMFMGPLGGAAASGIIVAGWRGFLLGLGVGGAVLAANAVVFDFVIERAIARLQPVCNRHGARLLTNVIGFAWAIAICAASIYLTLSLADRLGIFTRLV